MFLEKYNIKLILKSSNGLKTFNFELILNKKNVVIVFEEKIIKVYFIDIKNHLR